MNAARFAALIWALLLLAFWGTVVLTDLTAAGLLTEFVRAAVDGPWGWALLIAAYALRTVLLLPITILTVFAGYALGPWIGATFAVVAAVASSAASYGLARFVASGGRPPAVRAGTADDDGRVAIWMRQFRKRTFESVLVARVLGVPGDVVNVAAGAGRVPFVPFATATAVGGSPYLVAFALAGAALEESFGPDAVGFRWELAVIAVAVGAVGLLAATWLRHRRTRRDGDGRNGAGRNGTGERDGTGEGDRAR